MSCLSDNKQADVIEEFNSTPRYPDDLLNIDNSYFERILGQVYSTEVKFTEANF